MLAKLEAKHGRGKSDDIRKLAQLVVDQMQSAGGVTQDVAAEAVMVAAVGLKEAADHANVHGGSVPKVVL